MLERRVILFDLGGVLIGTRGREVLRSLLPHLSEQDIAQRWNHSRAVNRFECGVIAPAQFAQEFIAEWELALDPTQFMESFATWVTGPFAGVTDLLRALRTQHLVACLSNNNAVHWERVSDVAALFERTFASHLIGHMKPHPEAYRHVLRELNVSADAVHFFDDLAPNVAVARDVGMNAYQVAGVEEVRAVLRAQGLDSTDQIAALTRRST
jgi:putative hydrolase of the HAD superfamily